MRKHVSGYVYAGGSFDRRKRRRSDWRTGGKQPALGRRLPWFGYRYFSGHIYPVEEQRVYTPQPSDIPSSVGYLQIRNIRFIDENRNHIIESEEHSKVIFEIINTSHETVYNAVPIVQTDNKRIYVSPSVMLEQIAPHEGIKYTAHIRGGKRLKDGEVIIHIAIADYEGREYDWQEFTLPTQR